MENLHLKYMKTKFLIFIILVFASIMRIYNLGNVPPHLTPDEASLGYNAYSILKTGKDEYGRLLPIIFKSFGDFKPGLYVYLTVPFVATFGLNEISVRLPSAISGVISVYFIYLVVEKLFMNKKLSLFAALIAAINPWSIYLSRGAWEVNVSLTITLAGIYFFLVALEKKKYLWLSVASFAMTLITYQGAKLSTAVVVLILLGLYWKDVLRMGSKTLIVSLIPGIVISIPVILSFFSGGTGRLNVFSVFSYPRPKEYLQTFLDEGGEKVGSVSYYLFHSEGLNFARGILGRLFNHYSDRFLFFEGDWSNPRHAAPNSGVFLIGDLILIIAGLIALMKEKIRKEVLFVWLWALLAPLPSILSRDQVHAVRAYNLSVPLIIILAFGVIYILNLRKFMKVIIGLIYLFGFVYFIDAYFIHLPNHSSQLWEYGYKQIVQTVTPIQANYKTVKVQQSFAQPYIYFLFYQKYDPSKYQAQAKLVSSENPGDVGYVTKLDNIEFVPIDWSVNRGDHGSLIIADPIRIPPDDSKDTNQFKLVGEIKYLNGVTAFRIIEVK